MKRQNGYLFAMALLFSCCFAALIWPPLNGESPFELGLDLSGGVMVAYRPDPASRLEGFADLSDRQLLELARETLESRLHRTLSTFPDVVIQDDERIVVSLPSHREARDVLELVGKTYHLTLRLVRAEWEHPSAGRELFAYGGRYLELEPARFSGDMFDERTLTVEPGDPTAIDPGARSATVGFRFRAPHDREFAELTRESVGRTLAILLDDRVEWAGTIESAIEGAGVLRGGYSLEEAKDLARMLRAGTLPVSLEVESLSAIGPSLGQEIQDLGWRSLLLAVGLLVALVGIAYWHRTGLLLTGAASLGALLLLIAGAIAIFDLAVDLTGIAGLILSVGMGMDAFILVFEAARCGPAVGWRQLYSFSGEGRTLFHANATTLLVVLLLLETERLRSFAIFMAIGVIASILTIFMTRRLLPTRQEPIRFDLLGWLRGRRPNLFRWRYLYFGALLAGMVLTAIAHQAGSERALRLGADFLPGTQIVVESPEPERVERVVDALAERLPAAGVRHQRLGGEVSERYLITLGSEVGDVLARDESAGGNSRGRIGSQEVAAVLAGESVELAGMSSIDGRVSSRRLLNSLSVLALSFLFLGVYFALVQGPIDRYFLGGRAPGGGATTRLLGFVGILAALGADLGLVGIGMVWLSIPVNLPVIAALLTIVGYSVNDSVVLWSRVQAEGQRNPQLAATEVVSTSIDRILSRTVLTSLSTAIPALTILVVGLEPLRDFAWVMLLGTAAGTLSSIFIVGSFAVRALDAESKSRDALNQAA